jgi:hypothetical protein
MSPYPTTAHPSHPTFHVPGQAKCVASRKLRIFILDLRPHQQVDAPPRRYFYLRQLHFPCTIRPRQATNQGRRRASNAAEADSRRSDQVGSQVWRCRLRFKCCVLRNDVFCDHCRGMRSLRSSSTALTSRFEFRSESYGVSILAYLTRVHV